MLQSTAFIGWIGSILMPKIYKKTAENTEPIYLVPDIVGRYHSALRSVRRARRGLKVDSLGLLDAGDVPGCAIVASPRQWPRACRIMHTILTALEHRGHRILAANEQQPGVVVEVNGHVVAFELRENIECINCDDDAPSWYDRKYRPTGQLYIRLYRGSYDGSPASSMAEGDAWSIEDRIEDIAKRFEKIAVQMEEWRKKHEQWEEESRKREQRAARRQAVVDRRKAVEQALHEVVQQVKLVDEAETVARLIVARHPDSTWANALAGR